MQRWSCWSRSSTTSERDPVWPPSPRTGWWPSRTYRASGSGTGSPPGWARCRGGGGGVWGWGWWGGCVGRVGRPPQPVGTLDVYVTQPRAWTAAEVEALGALAVVTAELVSTGVELAVREVEVAQLRRGGGRG